MSATEEQQHRDAAWTLPCHFRPLSLMNCKSRAEAFAKSLHSKLKSLGRMAADDEQDEEEQEEEDGKAANPFAPSSIRKAATQHEKTRLISAPHHGSPADSFLSQHGEDELYFDFDISSPESPADHDELLLNRAAFHPEPRGERPARGPLVTRQPTAKAERLDADRGHALCGCSDFEFASSTLEFVNSTLEFTNSNLRRLDVECGGGDAESGCISAVSSVLTEQDNDDDDELFGLRDLEDAADLYPWSPPGAGLGPLSPTAAVPDYPASPCKLSTIVEQATLEESGTDVEEWLRADDLGQGRCACGYVAEAGLAPENDEEAAFMLHDGLPASAVDAAADDDSSGEDSNAMPSVEGPTSCRVRSDEASRDRESAAEGGRENAASLEPLEGEESAYRGWDPATPPALGLREPSPEPAPGLREPSPEPVRLEPDVPLPSQEPESADLREPEFDEGPAAGIEEARCRVCVSPPPASPELREPDVAPRGQQLTVDVTLSPSASGDELPSPTPDDDAPRRVRRSSSLKTGKTPPGTPNRKKIVRFADAMGLDLEAVKHVFLDDLPTVPSSAFVDLQDAADDEPRTAAYADFPGFGPPRPARSLVPVFPQPASLADFIDRVRRQSVCLESAVLAGDSSVRLVVRVLNLDFHKSVAVRYTVDEWATVLHAAAEYVQGSHDGFSDKFATVISADGVQVGERLTFAVRYVTQGREFWDNNYGQNYCFQCFPEQQYQPSPTDDSWVHFL